MKNRFINLIFFSAAGFFLFSCGDNTDEKKNPEVAGCPDLQELFHQIDDLRGELINENYSWDGGMPILNSFLERLNKNKTSSSKECSFTDHRQGPGFDRFDFVTMLADQTVKTQNPQGIDVLLKLSNIFSDDTHVLEFIGEELMKVAIKSPAVYLEHYNQQPALRKKLLDSTVWMPSKNETLLMELSALPGSEKLMQELTARFATVTPG